MEHLVPANKECEGDGASPISAEGKHVVIIGGGDTGADCLGTAHRQGAASVTQLDYNPEPPEQRDDIRSPWPTWPLVLRTSPAHAEGGARRYEVAVQRFVGDDEGNLRSMEIAEVRVERDAEGRRRITPVGDAIEIPCELALLAIGFEGVEHMALLDGLGLQLNGRGALACGSDWQTDAPGVFVCGDAHRGRITDRLGDRRGPQRRARRGRLPDGRVGSAGAGQARCAPAGRRSESINDYAEST